MCARRIEWLARGAWEGAAGKKGRNENALRELLLEEAGPLPEPESGLWSNTGKWTVWGDAHPDERRLHWAGAPWWRAAAWGGLGRLPRRMARGLSFYANGASFRGVSGQSLTRSPSWWHRHRSAKMDPRRDSRWWVRRKDWLLVSPFDCSWILQLVVGCWFCIPYQYLLSNNNSCKWLLCCLAGFGQWFPYYFFCCSLLKWFYFPKCWNIYCIICLMNIL